MSEQPHFLWLGGIWTSFYYSITDEKVTVDEILEFAAGRPVAIKDMFSLGRTKLSCSEASTEPPHPCPILLKLCTACDRRLILAAKHKLKSFRIDQIFIRKDLSKEERLKRVRKSAA